MGKFTNCNRGFILFYTCTILISKAHPQEPVGKEDLSALKNIKGQYVMARTDGLYDVTPKFAKPGYSTSNYSDQIQEEFKRNFTYGITHQPNKNLTKKGSLSRCQRSERASTGASEHGEGWWLFSKPELFLPYTHLPFTNNPVQDVSAKHELMVYRPYKDLDKNSSRATSTQEEATPAQLVSYPHFYSKEQTTTGIIYTSLWTPNLVGIRIARPKESSTRSSQKLNTPYKPLTGTSLGIVTPSSYPPSFKNFQTSQVGLVDLDNYVNSSNERNQTVRLEPSTVEKIKLDPIHLSGTEGRVVSFPSSTACFNYTSVTNYTYGINNSTSAIPFNSHVSSHFTIRNFPKLDLIKLVSFSGFNVEETRKNETKLIRRNKEAFNENTAVPRASAKTRVKSDFLGDTFPRHFEKGHKFFERCTRVEDLLENLYTASASFQNDESSSSTISTCHPKKRPKLITKGKSNWFIRVSGPETLVLNGLSSKNTEAVNQKLNLIESQTKRFGTKYQITTRSICKMKPITKDKTLRNYFSNTGSDLPISTNSSSPCNCATVQPDDGYTTLSIERAISNIKDFLEKEFNETATNYNPSRVSRKGYKFIEI